ncbi:MAG: cyclic nucleotide-binding domain-containing protein, partial [Rubrobacter sp.]
MQGVSILPGSPAGPTYGLPGLRERECLKLVGRLQQLGVATTTRRYEAGQDVFLWGEPADGLYVLTEGLVKLCKGYLGSREVSL